MPPPVATVKLGNAYQFEKFGTGNRLLRYGIRIRCSKRPPPVRDAFSEAFGVKNRLFRYGRDIRCAKQAPVVREAFSETFGDKKGLMGHAMHLQRCAKQPPAPPNAFSKARRTANSTDCGQPPAARDASSEACRAKSSTCRSGSRFSARNAPPPLSLFAPAAPSLAPSTALGTRNAHRSEVSKYKKRMTSKSIKTFQSSPFFYNNQSADYQKLNFSMACTR